MKSIVVFMVAGLVVSGAGGSLAVAAGTPDLSVDVNPASGGVGTEVQISASPCEGDPRVLFNDSDAVNGQGDPKTVPSSVSGGTLTATYTVAEDDEPGQGTFRVFCSNDDSVAGFEVTSDGASPAPSPTPTTAPEGEGETTDSDFDVVVSPESGPRGTVVDIRAEGCSEADNAEVTFKDREAVRAGANSPSKPAESSGEGSTLTARYTIAPDDSEGGGVFSVTCANGEGGEPFEVTAGGASGSRSGGAAPVATAVPGQPTYTG